MTVRPWLLRWAAPDSVAAADLRTKVLIDVMRHQLAQAKMADIIRAGARQRQPSWRWWEKVAL